MSLNMFQNENQRDEMEVKIKNEKNFIIDIAIAYK